MAQESHLESVSCLVDDEIAPSEARFLAARLVADARLAACWQRYHLIGATLRTERRRACDDLTDRIASALAAEAAPRRAAQRFGPLRPVAGLAVAATVAIAAYGWLDQRAIIDTAPGLAVEGPPRQTAPNGNFDASGALPQRATVASSAGLAQPVLRDPRLQAYVLRHNEAAGRNGQGLVPYVYLVSGQADARAFDGPQPDAPQGE